MYLITDLESQNDIANTTEIVGIDVNSYMRNNILFNTNTHIFYVTNIPQQTKITFMYDHLIFQDRFKNNFQYCSLNTEIIMEFVDTNATTYSHIAKFPVLFLIQQKYK